MNVYEADLALSKLVSSQTVLLTDTVAVDAGSLVTFTLTLSNSGPIAAAAGTEVSDLLPAGLTFESLVSASAGSFGQVGNQISWTGLPQIDDGSYQTLIYRAMVDAGTEGQTLQNSAAISATQQTDPNSSNDSSSAAVNVNANDWFLYMPFVQVNLP